MKKRKLLRKKITSRWIIFVLEQVLLMVAFGASYFVGSLITDHNINTQSLIILLAMNTLLSGVGMLLYKTHSGIIRYSEIKDISTVLRFTAYQMICWLTLAYFFSAHFHTNRIGVAIVLLNFGLASIFMIAFRLLVKEVYGMGFKGGMDKNRILIYGAGNKGRAVKKALTYDHKGDRQVVGFIEDDQNKIGKQIAGKMIFSGQEENLPLLFAKYQINKLIIAASLPKEKISLLTSLCAEMGISIQTLPPLQNWINGELHINQLHNLRIEELLGRDEINILNENSVSEFSDAVVLVTGAAGSIGSEICRQLSKFPIQKLILLDQSETGLHEMSVELADYSSRFEIVIELASIREEVRIESIYRKHRPDFVFHAAAYKHVPILEKFPEEVVHTNVKGTRILADLAIRYEVKKFVMISTDKAVNPTNLMGACKRIAELYVQTLQNQNATQFITTRFGNVLGSNGSVVPLFKKQLEAGGPITVTHPDITRYFMTIPEASKLVLEAAVMGQGNEIFVFDMGNPVKIVDLARKMIELSGKRPGKDVEIVFTGLRPGEKMFEELFTDKENLTETHHHKILKAKKSDVDSVSLTKKIDSLISELEEGNIDALARLIRSIVPEFVPEKAGPSPVKILYTNRPVQETILPEISESGSLSNMLN